MTASNINGINTKIKFWKHTVIPNAFPKAYNLIIYIIELQVDTNARQYPIANNVKPKWGDVTYYTCPIIIINTDAKIYLKYYKYQESTITKIINKWSNYK